MSFTPGEREAYDARDYEGAAKAFQEMKDKGYKDSRFDVSTGDTGYIWFSNESSTAGGVFYMEIYDENV